MLDEGHSSKLPHFLSVPVFEERLFPYESKVKMQSIHIKHPLLPVYINMCCDCTIPALQEKFSLAWKPSVKTKHWSTYWVHLHSLPFQRKYSSPSRNTKDNWNNLTCLLHVDQLLSEKPYTMAAQTEINCILGPSNLSKSAFYTC